MPKRNMTERRPFKKIVKLQNCWINNSHNSHLDCTLFKVTVRGIRDERNLCNHLSLVFNWAAQWDDLKNTDTWFHPRDADVIGLGRGLGIRTF